MLSIDEAIANERDAADIARGNIINSNNLDGYESWNNSQCIKCAEEHEQLAEWLGELKDYRDKNKMVVRIDTENVDSVKDKIDELSKYAEIQYNKAIDDFAKRLIEELSHTTLVKDGYYLANIIKPLAEQLKAGVNK